MCAEREQLISYVYGESDEAERAAIEEHLASCHECRDEVRGLRSLRQDLLAWEVPDHEPVWRPMTPVRVESPWRAVPAWAMTAAAGFILAVGAAGGAATHALLPVRPAQTAQAVTPAAVVPGQAEVTWSALEQRLLRLEQGNAAAVERLQTTSTHATPEDVARVRATTADLEQQIRALNSRQNELSRYVLEVGMETLGIRRQQTGLQQNNQLLVSLMQRQGGSQGTEGGR